MNEALIDRASGVSVWRQIETILAKEIQVGDLAEGSQLPTENDLAKRFSVNRHTIRRAVGSLSDQGLVRVEQGRGSFVRENVLEYMVGRRTRFSENVQRYNRSPSGRMVSLVRMKSEASIASELGLSPGMMVIRLVAVNEVDGRPVSHAIHSFPAKLFQNFEAVYEESRSITRVMEAHGYPDYERAWTKVTARMPDAADAELLEMPRTRPVLVSECLNTGPSGLPLQVSEVRYAADRFQMVFDTRPK